MAGMTGHRPKPDAVLKVGPAKKRGTHENSLANLTKRKRRYSKRQILEALQASNGLVHAAARKLGCTRQCLVKYFQRFPDLRESLEDIRDARVDVAEHHLMEQIQQNNTTATIFLLRCLGKGRGWVEDPKVQLHAHVEAGSGTWMEIMERVLARENSSLPEAAHTIIDVPHAPNRLLEKGVAESGDSEENE